MNSEFSQTGGCETCQALNYTCRYNLLFGNRTPKASVSKKVTLYRQQMFHDTGKSFTFFTQFETKWGRGVWDHLNQPMVSPSLCAKHSKGRGEFESTRTRRRPFTFMYTSVFTFPIFSPRVTNINFLLIISIHNQENRL